MKGKLFVIYVLTAWCATVSKLYIIGVKQEGDMQVLVKKGSDPFSDGYAPNSIWGTDPLYTKTNGTYHYYLNDHLGTPQQLAQKNGAKTWAASYEAFGKATITTSTITNNLRFPGQYLDSETGYHYNFHRTYDNQVGRYVSTDPKGLAGGEESLYVYVKNNPIRYFDPLGLKCYSFDFPTGIKQKDTLKWNKFGGWYSEGPTLQGGESPKGKRPKGKGRRAGVGGYIFYLTFNCTCARKKTGVRDISVSVLWHHVTFCIEPCGNSSSEYDYEKPLFDYSLDITKTERKRTRGGRSMSEGAAYGECDKQCMSLN